MSEHRRPGTVRTDRAGGRCPCAQRRRPLYRLHHEAAHEEDVPAGFLDGSTGAALAAGATTSTSWDSCLLRC
jgi:hypothetical protein